MQKTIKITVIFYLFFMGTALHAQEKEKNTVAEKGNILKINLPALAFKNISLQYERKILICNVNAAED